MKTAEGRLTARAFGSNDGPIAMPPS